MNASPGPLAAADKQRYRSPQDDLVGAVAWCRDRTGRCDGGVGWWTLVYNAVKVLREESLARRMEPCPCPYCLLDRGEYERLFWWATPAEIAEFRRAR